MICQDEGHLNSPKGRALNPVNQLSDFHPSLDPRLPSTVGRNLPQGELHLIQVDSRRVGGNDQTPGSEKKRKT